QDYAKQSRLTSGARSWVFGDLAERQEVGPPGRRQLGYPALVDEGDGVGLRAFATPAEARISHERGCTRLVRLVLGRELKPLRRDLPINVQAELVYRALGAHPVLSPELVYRGLAAHSAPSSEPIHRGSDAHPVANSERFHRGLNARSMPSSERVNRGLTPPQPPSESGAGRDLRDDLLDRIVMTVFLDGREPLRSAAAFEARVDSLRGGIGLSAQEISRLVQMLLERLGRIHAALPKAPAPSAADIRAQLAWLTPAGFLLLTPWPRLQEFPRYLQAIEQRLDKLGRDARRDPQLTAEIAPLEARWRERVRAERGLRPPGEDEFRWLLEEFRVSLFAQALKTRVTVSARRLEEAWLERERAPLA
ncbi:MAG: DUF3418 domain-containing protein, partial [Thermomicrobiales bacterium]|nr:DUF3418 domain-containing protein [Thermomicrobiales bacterium]